MDALPNEVLLNILHRLPLKSIGRCVCINKSWRSLIKTPSFVSADSKIRNKDDQYLFLWGGRNRLELRLEAENFGSYRLLTLPIKAGDILYADGSTISSISICNGLICYYAYPDVLVLWNPTIHRLLTLPQPTLVVADEKNCTNTFTLWFDSLTDDYKVIRLICLEDAIAVEPPQVETLSLNNNSWRIISGITPPFEFDGPSIPILNGALHWIGFCNGPCYKWNSILGFDVNDEVFWLIELPYILKTNYGRYFNLAVYKETSIALCCHESNDKPMELWVMKEYRNVESWTNIWRHDTSHQPLLRAIPLKISRSVIGLLNNGQVLWEAFDWANDPYGRYTTIIATDPESIIMKNSAVVHGTYYTEDVRYFSESLVLLDNASALSTAILVLLD